MQTYSTLPPVTQHQVSKRFQMREWDFGQGYIPALNTKKRSEMWNIQKPYRFYEVHRDSMKVSAAWRMD